MAEALQGVGDRQVGYVLDALVTQLARDAQAKWTAEADRQIAVVHTESEERLRMEGVGHVDAFPYGFFDGEVDDVTSLWGYADLVEHMLEGCSDPFSDVGPAFFAGYLGNLAVYAEAADVGERERCRVGDEAVDGELPIAEAVGLMLLEEVVGRRYGVGEGRFGDHIPRKLAGQRVSGEQALGGVGERLAGAIDTSAVWWDEAVTAGDFVSCCEAGGACNGSGAGGDEFAAREMFDGLHAGS